MDTPTGSSSPASLRRSSSIGLCPLNEGTSQMAAEQIVRNLAAESDFTKRYGTLIEGDARKKAKLITKEAFSVANKGNDENMLSTNTADSSPETVLLKGQWGFIGANEAEELLRPLMQSGNSCKKVCFQDTSFSLEAALVTLPTLTSLKGQLKEIQLSHIVAAIPEAEALEVLRVFALALEGSSLKSLDLSNNELGEKGVEALGSLLKSQNCLEELHLIDAGISEDAALALFQLIPSTEKLRILHSHNNVLQNVGALAISEVLKQSPLLEEFRCSSASISSDGGIALSQALESCTLLKKLDVRDNPFGVVAGVALSRAISQQVGLKEVYLSYLDLEDEGTVAIAEALKDSAPSLEVLEVAGNCITDKAAPLLAACVSEKQHLTRLSVAENELTDDGAIQIGLALGQGHSQLMEVNFCLNSIGIRGARALAQTVSRMPRFLRLNIKGNSISGQVMDEVKNILGRDASVLAP